MGEMQRRKFMIVPFFFYMCAFLITQYIVPNGLGQEANPLPAMVYGWTGNFFLMPIMGILIFFFIMPRVVDLIISKTDDGENYRMRFEWFFIIMAFAWTFVDFFNDFWILVHVI